METLVHRQRDLVTRVVGLLLLEMLTKLLDKQAGPLPASDS